jgi:hypothetical protein
MRKSFSYIGCYRGKSLSYIACYMRKYGCYRGNMDVI